MHAKVCVVDDVWASVGSDNFNRRSWTHDSELSCAVLDDTRDERAAHRPGRARATARGPSPGTCGCGSGASTWTATRTARTTPTCSTRRTRSRRSPAAADALQRWYDDGRVGARPPGRLRPHRPERLPWYTRLWALPAYRLVYDPDGRPLRARLRGHLVNLSGRLGNAGPARVHGQPTG